MGTDTEQTVLIIGAGHGGAGLAALLRQSGFTGSITMVGDEQHLPYHRPPLSKKFVGDSVQQLLRPESFYTDNRIDLHTEARAVQIRPDAKRVVLADGRELGYDTLVLATGSHPRTLPGTPEGTTSVVTLRTLDDAETLNRSLSRGGELVIIGGGYVGMEVAAVARGRDVAVTVIEREDRILARVASSELSTMLADYHRERGTRILTGRSVSELRTDGAEVTGVQLDDGTVIDCGTVLIGIGAAPDEALPRTAGLEYDDGVITDEQGRTSDPDIFAIGDVARRPVAGHHGLRRLESIPAATEHAKHAVAAIMGQEAEEHEVPWFWSDQFDLKLKIAGLTTPDVTVVTRETPGKNAVSFFHLEPEGHVVAVEAINAPADFNAAKKLIRSRVPVDPQALADPAVKMRDLIARSDQG
ncbi:NAD(P)/FAD-dependent oxidoreductase [Gordonia sp. OPL2]|uniref:NAD(P)/FAD-dependent oxidoreductase n=1 Tax=Gordonia sp. OPL2 TaxID=2486274 RepID=UPI001654FEF2|nr:FAD-dependent oxidoreductase [Gordonia sp. OPL2]RPA20092.1 ferredoxin reductase [Gordonia sp. OPL2]